MHNHQFGPERQIVKLLPETGQNVEFFYKLVDL